MLKIVHQLIKLKVSKAEYLTRLCLRQIIVEDTSEKMGSYTQSLIRILGEENEIVLKVFKDIGFIFAKLLRIASFVIATDTL